MSINDELNRYSRKLMNLLFPRKCPFCLGPAGKELVCARCHEMLPFTEDGEYVRGDSFSSCVAPLYHEGVVEEAMERFRLHRKPEGLPYFGSIMSKCAATYYAGQFDLISFVPVSEKKQRKLGYDPARYLAASVCVDWHVPPTETLRKIKDNKEQRSRKTHHEKVENVQGVYEVVNPEHVEGKRVLLIDDYIESGATLEECAHVLRDAGAKDVLCCTLAMRKTNPNT